MKVHFSALARRKLELLSIHLIIVWGEDTQHEFLDHLEIGLSELLQNPHQFDSIIAPSLNYYKLSEDTVLVYYVKEKTVTIVTLFDERQNPIIVYNDLIEHFT